MSKRMKFLTICAVVFCVGLAVCIGGLLTGGIKGIDKIAEKYDWLEGSPGDLQVVHVNAGDFSSISIEGLTDVVIIGGDYTEKDNKWNVSKELLRAIKESKPEEGSLFITHGENVESPEWTVEEGVLKITNDDTDEHVSLNFTGKDMTPKIVIFVGDRTMDNISLANDCADSTLLGVSFKKAESEVFSGDVYMKGVRSGGMKLKNETGDIELSGSFYGKTYLSAVSGDVEIKTALSKDKYSMDIKTLSGDIYIDDKMLDEDIWPVEYRSEGGKYPLIIRTDCGEAKVEFK